MVKVTDENKIPKNKKDENKDPLKDLNVIEEKVTIETEKDALDLLEIDDVGSIPEYDSESGSIIDSSSVENPENMEEESVVDNDEKSSKNGIISKINLLNKNDEKMGETAKSEVKSSSVKKSAKKLNKSNSNDEDSDKAETKIIDNVKVDEDGVPLLNQFDTEPIKENLSKKMFISKRNITQIILVIIGVIITIIGIIQALNDVLRISDHVIYGEHEAMAFGLIFAGILIILFAFYKEILNLLGVSNLTKSMDQMDGGSSSMPKPKSKVKDKK